MMNPATSPTLAAIDLWFAFYNDVAEERMVLAYRDLLSDAERRQELRFHFADDRRRYLVTRALVRTVLSRYACVAPQDWIFSTNAYGRPEIVNAQGTDAQLSFNLSHTRGLIVLGVSRRRALGVDVENLTTREVSTDIASSYFAPEEVSALLAAPPHEQQYRFFEYWTFKEAYIKARGMGLSLPLDKFHFRYPDRHSVDLSIDPELADEPARWQLWQLRPTREHLIAICAERNDAEATRLTAQRIIPLMSPQPIAIEVLRTSEYRRADSFL